MGPGSAQRLVLIAPGTVDTAMQARIRGGSSTSTGTGGSPTGPGGGRVWSLVERDDHDDGAAVDLREI